MKKILVSILSVLMVLALAAPVSADDSISITDVACELDEAIAQTEGKCFSSVSDAVIYLHQNVNGDERNNQHTVTLLKDYSGGGFAIGYESIKRNANGIETVGNSPINIKLELGGNTYTVTNPTVGSSGTETNGFQFLSGSTVYIQNGKILSQLSKILFQNYSSLTFDGVSVENTSAQYVMSNNNGKTVFKGGTSVTAGEGKYAMDSFCFSSYSGGDVEILDATINGDIEVANGGKLELNGGVVNGDLTNYNYDYESDQHENSTPVLVITAGTVNGNITTNKFGDTDINGGEINGAVVMGDDSTSSSVEISNGIIGSVGAGVTISNDTQAIYEASDGTEKIAIGVSSIETLATRANSGDTLRVTKGSIELQGIKSGVTISNEGDGTVTANGNELNSGGSIVITNQDQEKPSRPTYRPSSPSKDLPSNTKECQKEFGDEYIWSDEYDACVIKFMIVDTATR